MMRNLKGWAALALSAAMVVSMGACGTSDKTDSQASVDSNSSSTTGYDVSGVKKDEKIAKMLPSSVTKDGKLVTPKSDTILPSITRRSLLQVAKDYLGMEVEERPVALAEIGEFAECGLCGTAAVISPVGLINDHGKEIRIPSGMDEMGPVLTKLYTTLRGIQQCEIEAPEGWILKLQ